MSGVSPVGVAENGTRSGKESFDLLFMVLVVTNLLPCLPSLAVGYFPPFLLKTQLPLATGR